MTDSVKRPIGPNGSFLSNGTDIVLTLAILFLCYGILATFFQFGSLDTDAAHDQTQSRKPGNQAQGGIDFEMLKTSSPFGQETTRSSGAVAQGPITITKLDLALKGVRLHQTGQSSAIIKVANQQERSFTVGDVLMPEVTLKAVYFDFVQITNSGVSEQLYLDGAKPKKVNQR